jgi:hypothetical protein
MFFTLNLSSALAADEKVPLQGGVEETGAVEANPNLTPLVPMPAPVIKKKPVSGKVEQNSLQGQAREEGSNLKGGSEDYQLDKQNPLLDENSPHLHGSANKLEGKIEAEDPDQGDQELTVAWDKWHNRLLWSIQSGVQEIINSPENLEPHFDARRGCVVVGPNIPLGTRATFFVRVSNEKRIVTARIVMSSGYPDYDKALLDAIYSLDGTTILKFPRNSRRQKVNETATIITSDKGDRQFYKFGDVEKYRTPN